MQTYLSYIDTIEILMQLNKSEDEASAKVKQKLLAELILALEEEFKE